MSVLSSSRRHSSGRAINFQQRLQRLVDRVNLCDRYGHPAASGWNLSVRDVQSSGLSALEDHFSAGAITRCEDIADGALVVW
jgi:hypothetical protein